MLKPSEEMRSTYNSLQVQHYKQNVTIKDFFCLIGLFALATGSCLYVKARNFPHC